MNSPRPVIVAVDEHPDVLRALERELRRYKTDYGVRVLSGGPDAMMELTRLARSHREVALVLWGDCGYDIETTDSSTSAGSTRRRNASCSFRGAPGRTIR